MYKGRVLLAVFIVSILLPCCSTAEIENPVTVQSVKAKITVAGSGEITGQLHNGEVKLELLSFNETTSQRIVSLQETLSINGKPVKASRQQDEYGNKYAVFTVRETGRISYKIEAVIETDYSANNLQDSNLNTPIKEHADYLDATENVESNDERIRTIALNTFSSSSWLETLREVTDWTHGYITYDSAYYPDTYSALQTLESKRGVCDEFAALAAAMLRAKQIPTRFAAGVVYSGEGWGNHAWVEAFNPKSGWIAADPTYGEATIVDGTHFYRGAFPDPAGATAKITVRSTKPQDAAVSITEKNPVVEVEEAGYFNNILAIQLQDETLQANRWHDLNILIKNMLDSSLIAPVLLVLPQGFITESEEKIILFMPLEEKNIGWRVRINQELRPNQHLTGKYKAISLSEEKSAELKIVSGEQQAEESLVILRELLPLVQGNTLVMRVTLENLGEKEAEARFTVENAETIEKTVLVEAYGRATDSIRVENFSTAPYSVHISGPGLDYGTTITVVEGGVVKENPFGEEAAQESPLLQVPASISVETVLVAAILAGIVVIAFLLKALLLR